MNQWKPNIPLRYRLGLGVLLCMAILLSSTGISFARYRRERTAEITFSVQEAEQICLGTMRTISEEDATDSMPAGTEVFTPAQSLQWETFDNGARLELVIANGTSDAEFSGKDQKVTLTLLGTLGLWTGTETMKLFLQLPADPGAEETEMLQAAVTPIGEGTVLYHTHGPGWIYSFQNTEGELSWTLPGGRFSSVTLTITMEGANPAATAALQPRVTAEVIG